MQTRIDVITSVWEKVTSKPGENLVIWRRQGEERRKRFGGWGQDRPTTGQQEEKRTQEKTEHSRELFGSITWETLKWLMLQEVLTVEYVGGCEIIQARLALWWNSLKRDF